MYNLLVQEKLKQLMKIAQSSKNIMLITIETVRTYATISSSIFSGTLTSGGTSKLLLAIKYK